MTPNFLQNTFFVLKICLRYFFHNFVIGDNLEIDNPIIRNNSELLFLCIVPRTITRKSSSKFPEEFTLS